MTLSVRAKNLIMGGSLAAFAGSVFAYTVVQLSKVPWLFVVCAHAQSVAWLRLTHARLYGL